MFSIMHDVSRGETRRRFPIDDHQLEMRTREYPAMESAIGKPESGADRPVR